MATRRFAIEVFHILFYQPVKKHPYGAYGIAVITSIKPFHSSVTDYHKEQVSPLHDSLSSRIQPGV